MSETEGVTGFPQIVQAENYVIKHHLADVISQSFAATEQTFPSAQSILKLRSAYVAAAKAGVTVLAGSGDPARPSASNDTGRVLHARGQRSGRPPTRWSRRVGGPSTSWTRAVTSRSLRRLERHAQLGEPAASGGGKSIIFSRPSFQNSVAARVGNQRGVPDISLSGAVNGGALVYYGDNTLGEGVPAGFYIIGGTSEATPELAGVVALAAQKAGHGLGVINGAIYRLNAAHAPGIVDVTAGTNTVTFNQDGADHTVLGWDARTGYDLATGVGGINGADFVPELAAAAK